MIANRNASVPLLTAMQCRASQNVAKSFSKFCHHRAADKPSCMQALSKRFRQLLFEFHMRRNQIKKWNRRRDHWILGVAAAHKAQNSGRISRHNRIRRHILGDDAARADDRVFADRDVFGRIVAPEPIDAPFLITVRSTFQSASVCRCSVCGEVARG